jgi:hypothetical protein
MALYSSLIIKFLISKKIPFINWALVALSVILAIQEADIRRLTVRSQPPRANSS